jgi:hypothetical protein
MSELASFSESSRQSALQRFQLLRAHLGVGRSLAAIAREAKISYALPNKSFQEVRAMMESGALDPLRDFSEACHEELSLSSNDPYLSKYRDAIRQIALDQSGLAP